MRVQRPKSSKLTVRRREHCISPLDHVLSEKYGEVSQFFLLCFIKARVEGHINENNGLLNQHLVKLSRRFLVLCLAFLEKYESMRTIDAEILWRKLDNLILFRLSYCELFTY
jgi:hypothetical protein